MIIAEKNLTKIGAGLAGAFLLLATFAPLTAQAQIPVTDTAHIIETTLGVGQNTITAAETTVSAVQKLYEWGQSFALAALKKEILDNLSQRVVQYVQGGGAPKYVQNWDDFFAKARLSGAEAAAAGINNAKLCDTFGDAIRKSVGQPSGDVAAPSNFDSSALDCDFAPGELESFQKDFNNGGWDAYFKTLEPKNNALGAYQLAKNIQEKAAIDAQEAAKSEAIAGGGFLSPKTRDANGQLVITTPGSVLKDLTSRAAATDIDFVANADQLSQLVGGLSQSVISKMTSDDDSGLSGVNVAQIRANRANQQRNPDGSLADMTAEDCDTAYPVADVNNDGQITQEDIDADAQGVGNYTLNVACKANIDAQNGAPNRRARLMSKISEIVDTLRSAKLALKDLGARQKALTAFTDTVNGVASLDPNRNCLNPDGTPKQGRKLLLADKNAGLTKDTIERSIETGESYDPSRKKWLPCLVDGESRTITYGGKDYQVDGYDTFKRNIETLVELRSEVDDSIQKLADFRAEVRITPESAKDFSYSPPVLKIALLEQQFASGDEITDDSTALSAAVPAMPADPSEDPQQSLLTAIKATTPSDPNSTGVLLNPQFNIDRASYILGLARGEVDTPNPAGADPSSVQTNTDEEVSQ